MEGIGAVVVGIALFALLIWAAIVVNARRPQRLEATPQNLQPFLTDDELESKRVNTVLLSALIGSAVLALVIPIYYLGEASRQASATESRVEHDIEEGAHWYDHFFCLQCHGADGGGGGATFIEARSGNETLWFTPSLNDVFLRYSEDEIRFWITFGRRGTPMPAAGLEGGGSLTSQQIDQLVAYLRSIQVDQSVAVGAVDTKVNLALDRIDRARETVAAAVEAQQAAIDEIKSKPSIWNEVKDVPATINALLSATGTCTDDSAELVGLACAASAGDSDRDGLGDSAEVQLTALFRKWGVVTEDDDYLIDLDPANAFTNADRAGNPLRDIEFLDQLLIDIEVDAINLRVAALSNSAFVETAEVGLAYLEEAQADAKYFVDLEALAGDAFDGNLEDARRAVGLYDSHCARCHTAGYSAGVPFQQEAGSGAWGPSLLNGKALNQFPDIEDHFDFVAQGSEQSAEYGVNGLGRGWMPAFGFTLSREDIMLIVRYERAL
ncbi:MAG: c-type cytochrome [Acidimicrobiia bacterium]